MTHQWGISTHGKHKADPPLHVIRMFGTKPLTWCGGGAAYADARNVTGRTCRRCEALIREEGREYGGAQP